jgi:hypothetical protein
VTHTVWNAETTKNTLTIAQGVCAGGRQLRGIDVPKVLCKGADNVVQGNEGEVAVDVDVSRGVDETLIQKGVEDLLGASECFLWERLKCLGATKCGVPVVWVGIRRIARIVQEQVEGAARKRGREESRSP